ncbi:MAG: hypothetical protein J6X72_01975 [Clostridia bacterium]|nr:hypothetical protein [Clostridia bacterium]
MKKRRILTVLILVLLAALIAAILLTANGCPARIKEKDLANTARIVIRERTYADNGEEVEEREITDPDAIADVLATISSLKLKTVPKNRLGIGNKKPSPPPRYELLFYYADVPVDFTSISVFHDGKITHNGKGYTVRDDFDLFAYLAGVFDAAVKTETPADQVTQP